MCNNFKSPSSNYDENNSVKALKPSNDKGEDQYGETSSCKFDGTWKGLITPIWLVFVVCAALMIALIRKILEPEKDDSAYISIRIVISCAIVFFPFIIGLIGTSIQNKRQLISANDSTSVSYNHHFLDPVERSRILLSRSRSAERQNNGSRLEVSGL